MRVLRLWLADFRNYRAAELDPAPDGLTAIVGPNGHGKTNLLEAIAWLARMESFRSAPPEALVRDGAERAVLRAEAERDGRSVLVEAELPVAGRARVQVNRQPLRRARDLLGAIQVTVFSPDDLALVKGGPGERRRWLDDVLVALHPRHDRLRADLDRILRQRNTLLRQAGGRVSGEVASTLDVWDAKLAEVGEALAGARADLVARAEPDVAKSYRQVAEGEGEVSLEYLPSWWGGARSRADAPTLADALAAGRADDVRRGVSLVGPHRDELAITLDGLAARTHASQGEQRSLALALRLAAHRAVAETAGTEPVVLLDDVFSELDAGRSAALAAALPPAQALLTTAGALPHGMEPARVVRIAAGEVVR